MDTYITVAAFILWVVGLWAGIVWARKHWDPWWFIPHGLSALCSIGLLATLTRWLGWNSYTVGWWILAVMPAAVVINLVITWIISTIWPHCKECGSEKLPTNFEVGRGTPDQGYVIIKTCPKCKK